MRSSSARTSTSCERTRSLDSRIDGSRRVTSTGLAAVGLRDDVNVNWLHPGLTVTERLEEIFTRRAEQQGQADDQSDDTVGPVARPGTQNDQQRREQDPEQHQADRPQQRRHPEQEGGGRRQDHGPPFAG